MKFAASLVSLVFALNSVVTTNLAFGAAPPLNPDAPDSFTVTIGSMRNQILNSNLSLQDAFNKVSDAKDRVSVARLNLIPSANLGAVTNLVHGLNFAVNSVEFLLPFLIPSNWSALDAQKDLFEAEKLSYKILQLNTYSSALGLYFTVLSDKKMMDVYNQAALDYEQIAEIHQIAAEAGTASDQDAKHALANAEMARSQASQMARMMNAEIAALRTALNLPLSTQINFDQADNLANPDHFEQQNTQKLADQATQVSPEQKQVDYLVKAASSEKWSAIFGFIDSAFIGAQSNPQSDPQSADFSKLKGSVKASIGFSYFPTIKISQRNIETIKNQKKILAQGTVEIMEANIKGLGEVLNQFSLTSSAESKLNDLYLIEREMYDAGTNSYESVLLAHVEMTTASIARIQSELDQNLVLTTLHRALLSGPYSEIKGCQASSAAPKTNRSGFWGWIGGVIGSSQEGRTDLEKICRASGT